MKNQIGSVKEVSNSKKDRRLLIEFLLILIAYIVLIFLIFE